MNDKCDVCGKNMRNPLTGLLIAGCDISFFFDKDKLPENKKFIKRQMGKYSVNRHYKACLECFMKRWGFKP
jgi:hypothetical protein